MLKKIIIITVIIFLAGLWYWRNLNLPVDKNGSTLEFSVNQGESAKDAAENLKKENLIKSILYFRYIAGHSQENIKAGAYLISPRLTIKEIFRILSQGKALDKEKTIRIIEGWSIKDINNYLNNNKIVKEDSFAGWAKQDVKSSSLKISLDEEFTGGMPQGASLEGYLFPDTYRIDQDATARDIIKKMLDNFSLKINARMREEIARQKKSVHEIITMASIIEKEVRSVEDMKIVSDIFWGRIQNGQGLESDATLSYILGTNKSRHNLEETKFDSLYNTYRYRGLPPGPIANPGLNAIAAAIYPSPTDYNYFLSDPANGKTIYSRSLKEHNLNKARYLK